MTNKRLIGAGLVLSAVLITTTYSGYKKVENDIQNTERTVSKQEINLSNAINHGVKIMELIRRDTKVL